MFKCRFIRFTGQVHAPQSCKKKCCIIQFQLLETAVSKFWGDVVDSDTTDGTMDPDIDHEKMNMHLVALKYLEAQPDAHHHPCLAGSQERVAALQEAKAPMASQVVSTSKLI